MRSIGGALGILGSPASTHTTADAKIRQSADPFSQNGASSAVFIRWVCSLASTAPQAATSPPPNGGNGVIRATTRRRHAASQLLVVQNPHRSQPRAPRCIQDWRGANYFALAPTIGPRRATNIARMTQKHGDIETNNTTATADADQRETTITTARS